MLGSPVSAEPNFDAMFQDYAVLQRDQTVAIWGTADPEEEITVQWQGSVAKTAANAKGEWRASLPARSAGHRGELIVQGKNGGGQTLKDVVAGDVFLCSGQSNMQMAVQHSQNSENELNDADHADIRLFQVNTSAAAVPQSEFKDRPVWKLANRESVAPFSAVCFQMARELRRHHNVPIGLIHSSWGGTVIDTWRSPSALAKEPSGAESMALLKLYDANPAAANRQWGERWATWWKMQSATSPWLSKLPDAKPVPIVTNWEKWGVDALKNYDGQMWLQAEFTLNQAQAKQAATLNLGKVDDLDQSWVNGVGVGTAFGFWIDRAYPLSTGVLKSGVNQVTVHITDIWARAGGLVSPAKDIGIRFADGSFVALNNWSYSIEKNSKIPISAPWNTHFGTTTVGNAMIAPMMPYTLKGIAWYQGESDADSSMNYQQKLVSLMQDWRQGFEQPDLPFFVVQLADFGPSTVTPSENGWANIREAQRRAVTADKNAGLVVIRDLGDRLDVHPTNKQWVGQRLATAVRAIAYNDPVSPSGPELESAAWRGDNIVVGIKGAVGDLKSYSSNRAIGFELCGATPDDCYFADAIISGQTIVIQPTNRIATRVRYCWGNSSICNVFDSKDLPLGSFEVNITR